MKHIFKRVVVLINEIKYIDDLLKKGIEFSKQHNTTLEVLFVQEKSSPSLFEYLFFSITEDKPFNKERVEKRIKKYINKLDSSTDSKIFIVEDNILERVLTHGDDASDILFITNYDKKLSQKLLEKTPYSYWIFKNSSLKHKNIILPIELGNEARDDIKLTKDIFPKSSIEIVHDYRYMIPKKESDGSSSIIPIVGHVDKQLHIGTKAKNKHIFENYKKEFNVHGDFIEEEQGLDRDLLDYIKKKNSDLVVIHHQEEELFVPSLTFNLLNELPSDFLVLNR